LVQDENKEEDKSISSCQFSPIWMVD
jgi:hypothetical protein